MNAPAADPNQGLREALAVPDALRQALADDVEGLSVCLTEACLADGVLRGFQGPYEEFGRVAEPLLLDALGSARRDGAAIAQAENARLSARVEELTRERDEALAGWSREHANGEVHRDQVSVATADRARIEAETADLRAALKGAIAAWEHLSEGHYEQRTIQEWLVTVMAPALKAARAALAQPETPHAQP